MKKIFLLAIMICFVLTSTAFAARDFQNVGVVIIGGAEFKTDDYYKIVRNEINPKSGAKLLVGNEIQTRYKKYWLNRGFIGEQTPQKQDLIDFAAMSGCRKIICLIVSDVVDDQRNSGKHRQQNRISVQLDAYLCTPTNVEDVFSASKEFNSKGSALKARSGAFKKCLAEISKGLNRHI